MEPWREHLQKLSAELESKFAAFNDAGTKVLMENYVMFIFLGGNICGFFSGEMMENAELTL